MTGKMQRSVICSRRAGIWQRTVGNVVHGCASGGCCLLQSSLSCRGQATTAECGEARCGVCRAERESGVVELHERRACVGTAGAAISILAVRGGQRERLLQHSAVIWGPRQPESRGARRCCVDL